MNYIPETLDGVLKGHAGLPVNQSLVGDRGLLNSQL